MIIGRLVQHDMKFSPRELLHYRGEEAWFFVERAAWLAQGLVNEGADVRTIEYACTPPDRDGDPFTMHAVARVPVSI